MSNRFELINGSNHWGIVWSMFPRHLFKKQNILDILFNEFDNETVTLLIQLNNRENETFTVDRNSWANSYGVFLQDYYIINGVVFQEKQKANEFYTWLEKAHVWHELTT